MNDHLPHQEGDGDTSDAIPNPEGDVNQKNEP